MVAIVVTIRTIAVATTTINNAIRIKTDTKIVAMTTGVEATTAEVAQVAQVAQVLERMLALSHQFAQMIGGQSRTSVIVRNSLAANGRTMEEPTTTREADDQFVEVTC